MPVVTCNVRIATNFVTLSQPILIYNFFTGIRNWNQEIWITIYNCWLKLSGICCILRNFTDVVSVCHSLFRWLRYQLGIWLYDTWNLVWVQQRQIRTNSASSHMLWHWPAVHTPTLHFNSLTCSPSAKVQQQHILSNKVQTLHEIAL